jgi:hypothetical protein
MTETAQDSPDFRLIIAACSALCLPFPGSPKTVCVVHIMILWKSSEGSRVIYIDENKYIVN